MELDLDARRNLELAETLRAKDKKGTLLWVLDKTQTPMGGRQLRSWLEKPLLDAGEIISRQNAVEELVNDTVTRGELTEALKYVTDFERVMTRIVTGTVNCRDLLSLAGGLRSLPDIKRLLQKSKSPMLQRLQDAIDPLTDCADLIEIQYSGTVDQWNSITKGEKWNYNTGNYTVTCTDGTISKN
jgi:DNA mismatch repair protein MutS